MGCNAWNHPDDCECGWGGDTGGWGGGRSSSSNLVRRVLPADGRIWASPGGASADSYVNPNAHCPVCGATVFFYQSPHGGRVFFDELGPPWPKHPCTDNSPAPRGGGEQWWAPGAGGIVATDMRIESPRSYFWEKQPPQTWKPLRGIDGAPSDVPLAWRRVALWMRGRFPLFPIPEEITGDAPVFWRWSNEPGMIDLETIEAGEAGEVRPVSATVPGWLQDGDDVSAIRELGDIPEPTAERWYELGWQVLFGGSMFRMGKWEKHMLQSGFRDSDLARACFTRAAQGGHREAANCLGVIFREALGVQVDRAEARRWFDLAGTSEEDQTIGGLYRRESARVAGEPGPGGGGTNG